MLQPIKRRLGLKDRSLLPCPGGRHTWRRAYGDERRHYGLWHCEVCPYGRNGPEPLLRHPNLRDLLIEAGIVRKRQEVCPRCWHDMSDGLARVEHTLVDGSIFCPAVGLALYEFIEPEVQS